MSRSSYNVIERTFMVANYGANGGAVDNDDGSSWCALSLSLPLSLCLSVYLSFSLSLVLSLSPSLSLTLSRSPSPSPFPSLIVFGAGTI